MLTSHSCNQKRNLRFQQPFRCSCNHPLPRRPVNMCCCQSCSKKIKNNMQGCQTVACSFTVVSYLKRLEKPVAIDKTKIQQNIVFVIRVHCWEPNWILVFVRREKTYSKYMLRIKRLRAHSCSKTIQNMLVLISPLPSLCLSCVHMQHIYLQIQQSFHGRYFKNKVCFPLSSHLHSSLKALVRGNQNRIITIRENDAFFDSSNRKMILHVFASGPITAFVKVTFLRTR